MAQSHERWVSTANKIIFAGLSILLEPSISRQMLKNIQRSTRIWNTLSDVFIEHCPWRQAPLKFKEPWVGR